ncbi:unnamed protein product [Musa acuminata subsp. burmannicoides]
MKAKTARLGGHRGGIGGLRGAGEVVAHVAEELRAAVRAVAGVHRVDPHGRRGNAEGYQLRRPYQGGHPRNQLRIRREDRVGQGDWVDIWFGDGGHIDGRQDALPRLEVGVLHPREGGVQRFCSHQPVGPASPGAALGAGLGGDLLKPALPSVVRLRRQPEIAGEVRVHQHHRVPVHVDPPPRLLHHSGHLPPHREIHHPYYRQHRERMVPLPLPVHHRHRNPRAPMERRDHPGLVA